MGHEGRTPAGRQYGSRSSTDTWTLSTPTTSTLESPDSHTEKRLSFLSRSLRVGLRTSVTELGHTAERRETSGSRVLLFNLDGSEGSRLIAGSTLTSSPLKEAG